MKAKLLGFRKMDFVSGDGQQVKGTQLGPKCVITQFQNVFIMSTKNNV
nr:hypothetical protein [uncultured Caproiciproducens sp.]